MKKIVAISIAILITALIFGIAVLYMRPFGGELVKKNISIGGVTFTVEIADAPMSRAQGLSGRQSLSEGEGMLFLFSSPGKQAFWMKGMNFPIDMVWINGSEVVGFSKNAQPEPGKNILSLTKYYPPGDVDKVLEINAGDADRLGLMEGDRVVIGDITEAGR